MGQRKIDDDLLLKMLKDGKPQKDIAEHFGVSPAAISKRLKRLLPPPKSLENLTDKEKRFAIEVASGRTQTQAALNSFDVSSRESAKVIGSNLMARPEVKMAVSELMDYHGLSQSYRIKKLKVHVDNMDPNISLKALDQSFKLDGSYAPIKNLNANLDFPLIDLTPYRNWSDKDLQRMDEIRQMLTEDPGITDQDISSRLGLNSEYVDELRREIERRSQNEND